MPYSYKKRKRSSGYYGSSKKSKSFKVAQAVVTAVDRNFGGKPGRAVSRRASMNTRTGGLLGIEKKYYDTFLNTTLVPSSVDWTGGEFNPAAPDCLNAVTQGDGPTQRDGNSITMKSIHIQGWARLTAMEAQPDPTVSVAMRFALVLDTQCRGTEINAEDVYGTPGDSAMQAVFGPLRNMSYSTRFKVLKQKLVILNQQTMTTPGQVNLFDRASLWKPWKMDYIFPSGGLKVRYLTGGTTEVVANITDNALFMIALATSAAASTQEAAYTSRLRFVG